MSDARIAPFERLAQAATEPGRPDEDLRQTRVSQVMSTAVVAVRSSSHLDTLADWFTGTGLRHLVVVDACDHVVGLVSHERVIAAWFDPLSRRPTCADDVVEANGAHLRPASTVQEAAQLMTALELHAVPVVHEDGRVAGVLTQTDLVALLAGTDRTGDPAQRA
jgi:CBS-domain-containing membrane protein